MKYVYANIKIPVEVKTDGSIEPLKDYINIEFTECNELPEKNTNLNYSRIMDSLSNFVKPVENTDQSNTNEPMYTVLKEEIKKNTKAKVNTSFKNTKQYKNRHTSKYRENA
jgi:GTP cyclohydrolase FolE2